jgi:hypothetical protein
LRLTRRPPRAFWSETERRLSRWAESRQNIDLSAGPLQDDEMQPQQWVLVIIGGLLILWGAGLMTYAVVHRKPMASAAEEKETWGAQILHAFADLFKALGDYFGPDIAMKAGGIIFLAGLAMVFGAFLIPGGRS